MSAQNLSPDSADFRTSHKNSLKYLYFRFFKHYILLNFFEKMIKNFDIFWHYLFYSNSTTKKSKYFCFFAFNKIYWWYFRNFWFGWKKMNILNERKNNEYSPRNNYFFPLRKFLFLTLRVQNELFRLETDFFPKSCQLW